LVGVGEVLVGIGVAGSAGILADDVTIVGVVDDPLLIVTGGVAIVGGTILWFAK
jgi:hypothetical protein